MGKKNRSSKKTEKKGVISSPDYDFAKECAARPNFMWDSAQRKHVSAVAIPVSMVEDAKNRREDPLKDYEPPEVEEPCPICLLPLPLEFGDSYYFGCCSKLICYGCMLDKMKIEMRPSQNESREERENRVENASKASHDCPFCRQNYYYEMPQGERVEREIRHAENGSSQAAYRIGLYHEHGEEGVEVNVHKAMEWYQKAADAGHTQAITKMGNHLRQSKRPEDQEKSQQWLSQAAQQGDAYAMLCLGVTHRDGIGVPRDLKLAQYWFEQSRAAGDPAAITHLAELWFKLKHSPAKALPYYLEARTKGIPCDEALAAIYNTRSSGVYAPLKAKEHYEILLRRGEKAAPWVMLELAKLHASGQVSDNGKTHARKWCYQIISQCPKTRSTRIKAEQLLKKLDESLF